MSNQIQVVLVKAPFKRTRIVAQIGQDVFSHNLLFVEADNPRAASAAAALEARLKAAADPAAELSAELWEGPGKSEKIKRSVFKPAKVEEDATA